MEDADGSTELAIENKFTRTHARFILGKKIVSAFLLIFQLMLGQKFEITLVATFIDFKNFTSWTSVFHYLKPSLPLLKSGHEKLQGTCSSKFVLYIASYLRLPPYKAYFPIS